MLPVGRLASASVFCTLAALAGCSDQHGGRVPVGGKVTLVGQPLAQGVIFFEPVGGQGSAANKPLTNGEFRFDKHEGLLPGKYVVRITSADTTQTVGGGEAGGPGGSANVTFFDIIPPEWNVASKQEVTVTADGKNEFAFDIPNRLESRKKR